MCVYIYIYIYIYIYTWINMSMHIHMYICMYMYMRIFMSVMSLSQVCQGGCSLWKRQALAPLNSMAPVGRPWASLSGADSLSTPNLRERATHAPYGGALVAGGTSSRIWKWICHRELQNGFYSLGFPLKPTRMGVPRKQTDPNQQAVLREPPFS